MSPLPGAPDSQSPPPVGSSNGGELATPAPSIPNNRQRFNERLQKYHLSARFDFKCEGPQNAQKWRGFCYVGSIFVGCSKWYSNMDAAKEDACGHGLEWFDKFGYP